MKRTKKMLCLLLALALFAPCLMTAALADVLWEPSDDFYSKHYRDCEYVYRNFICNGGLGYVNVYRDPESGKVIDSFKNGTKVYISQSYKYKGTVYGVAQYIFDESGEAVPDFRYDKSAETGWIDMSELSLVYDAIAFDEEHSSEYVSKEIELDISEYKNLVLWSYPGSGVVSASIPTSDISGIEELNLSTVWTDEEGREWANIGYWRGIRNVWLCISEPENENLDFETRVSEPDVLIPAAEEIPEPKNGNLTLIIVIVAAVVVLTLVIILILRRKKAGQNETQGL